MADIALQILKWALVALAQTGIAFLGGILVEHHVISGAQEKTLTAWAVNHALLATPVVAATLWTVWLKYRGKLRMLVALQPGVHTEDQVKAILKAKLPTPTIATPSNTIPGVPTT